MLFPVGAKPFELRLNLPVEVFWQRGRGVEASQKAYEQLAAARQQAIERPLDLRMPWPLAPTRSVRNTMWSFAGERIRFVRRIARVPGKVEAAVNPLDIVAPLPADALLEKAMIARLDLRAFEIGTAISGGEGLTNLQVDSPSSSG
jgi:hypothetical protein